MGPPEQLVSWSSGDRLFFFISSILFLIVSCLSFAALSEHKDVALVSDSCASPSSGAALLQNSDGKTTQLGLDESLLGGEKISSNLLNKAL